MKQRLFIALLLAFAYSSANSQVSPNGTATAHSDSCWYFTFDYDTPDVKRNEGVLIVTHICTPDTCISSAKRHVQGKRYAKKYTRKYGHIPELIEEDTYCCTLSMPETAVADTVWGVTYSEHIDKDGVIFECDTVAIYLPQAPPMSNHRVKPTRSIADHLAKDHPYVKSISSYVPITEENINSFSHIPAVVRYTTNSNRIDPEYLNNAENAEELMNIINSVLADSTTTLQSVQLIGYTSPEEAESGGLGHSRAVALRNHILSHHHVGDSLFEIYDGGKNWNRIYDDITELDIEDGDSIIHLLRSTPSGRKRTALLKSIDNGRLYSELEENAFMHHRGACCGGIYYQNSQDSIAVSLNKIVDELINNPNPDYSVLLARLKEYKDDPRVLNLQGVIEYRRHHRHAAEQAFAKAAAMGDEQAAVNLQIVENNKNSGPQP